MLDLKALIVVREVGRCGSFGRAAQALSCTPSAVSQRIAALERAHGVTLFERSPRGVRPTPAGRLLLRHVEQLLPAEEAARTDLVAAADLRRGLVRIGTFATAAAGFVADALRFAGSEHGLEFEVVEAEPYVLLPRCSRAISISPSCSATRASRPASRSRDDAPSTRACSHQSIWATTHSSSSCLAGTASPTTPACGAPSSARSGSSRSHR